jgi:hypothetical protein
MAGSVDMVSRKPTGTPTPRTLMEAHELLTSLRPARDASPEYWLQYYRRSAAVYAEVAEIDRGHHHEARYWANREEAKANAITARVAKKPRSATEIQEDSASEETVHKEQN